MSAPRQVVIVDAVRTPVGKFLGGASVWTATELGACVVGALLERNAQAGDAVDEVILGNVVSAGLGQAPARQAAIGGGVGLGVPAVAVNQVCGASLRAVVAAAQAIRCGDARCVIAGGMESMSNAPHLVSGLRRGVKAGDQLVVDAMVRDGLWCAFENHHMGLAAEYTAKKSKISRRRQDEFALLSHRKAAAAWDAGAFADEVVLLSGSAGTLTQDETLRRDTSLEKLSDLPPAFCPEGTVTAGNAPGLNDAAAAVLVMDDQRAKTQGLTPLARVAGYALAGTEPIDLFYAPVAATQALLGKLNMAISDFDLIEVNEAFAVQALADGDLLGWDWARVNVHGGAIALGHPLGASGARLLTTLVWALKRHDKQWGLATICMGGGLGLSLAVERTR